MTTIRASITACLTLGCVLALAPATAFAVTVDQIVALSRAGVSDAVIVALIERDRSVFALDPAEIVELQREGVSEPVTVAMLRSTAPDQAAVGQEAPAVTAMIPPPDIVAYTIAVPVRRSRLHAVVPATQAPLPATSAKGIFFSRPATGIFFAPPAAPDCPRPVAVPHRR